jgi:hypothetical protein
MVPNDALVSTIPFYVASIIPFATADVLLSFSKAKISQYAAGAIVGLTFFMLYYPLITYTYNEVMKNITVWPSLIAPTYFEMIGKVFPLVIIPAIAMGILGSIASNKIIARNKVL